MIDDLTNMLKQMHQEAFRKSRTPTRYFEITSADTCYFKCSHKTWKKIQSELAQQPNTDPNTLGGLGPEGMLPLKLHGYPVHFVESMEDGVVELVSLGNMGNISRNLQ